MIHGSSYVFFDGLFVVCDGCRGCCISRTPVGKYIGLSKKKAVPFI